MVTNRPCKGFGAEIRLLREEKKMTEDEFAWLLNTDTKAITRLEKEELYPSSNLIKLIADSLHIDEAKVLQRIWCDLPEECSNSRMRS
ncbi:helix-turn-helix domain-containing protein [Halobacillus sp. K22]|uniref:helix-turn-helix domain-containing protein n=1 Tax=Halobacillus sp. K22 TaxID=3457431 RepID=UPI003FCEC579